MASSHTMEMAHENHLFLGNPGTGKSTLVNCLLGEKKFVAGLSWAGGLTKAYQRFDKDGIAYMDTPGLADDSILEQAARAITTALKQGGSYKLFFMIRLQAGRIVSEDIVTLERVLDSIDAKEVGDLNYKYTVVMNCIGVAQYKILMTRGEEFEKVKALVNRKYCTDSFCFVPRIPELEETDAIVDLPQPFSDGMKIAPMVRIDAQHVRAIDVTGFAEQAREIQRELEKLRSEQAELLRKVKEQEERHQEVLRAEREKHQLELEQLRQANDAIPIAVAESPKAEYQAFVLTPEPETGGCSRQAKLWGIIGGVIVLVIVVVVVLVTKNSGSSSSGGSTSTTQAPSISNTYAPSLSYTTEPPVSYTTEPPLSRTTSPPVSRTISPPVVRTTPPPVSRTTTPASTGMDTPSVTSSPGPKSSVPTHFVSLVVALIAGLVSAMNL